RKSGEEHPDRTRSVDMGFFAQEGYFLVGAVASAVPGGILQPIQSPQFHAAEHIGLWEQRIRAGKRGADQRYSRRPADSVWVEADFLRRRSDRTFFISESTPLRQTPLPLGSAIYPRGSGLPVNQFWILNHRKTEHGLQRKWNRYSLASKIFPEEKPMAQLSRVWRTSRAIRFFVLVSLLGTVTQFASGQ